MSKAQARKIAGGVLAPRGFRGGAASCGLKTKRGALDVAIIASEVPATAAGLFTTNRVAAAPVRVSRKRVARGRLSAIVVNAGNANACTGPGGVRDAEAMTALAATALGLKAEDVAVASTGMIGHRLPMGKIENGIRDAAACLGRGGGASAAVARAIMTTDTVPKSAAVAARIGGVEIRVGGMVKGVGMIAPKMATMLAFLTTDARVSSAALGSVLKHVVDLTFNRVTVEGDTSTNDSVFLLANGAAGGTTISGGAALAAFRGAVLAVADSLAEQMILDAEGATKFITVSVSGAASAGDAELAGRAVAECVLLKCALFGGDPNWGRIACAAGYSGARFEQERLAIDLGGIPVVRRGTPVTSKARLVGAVKGRRIEIQVDLGAGRHATRFRTCDLSHKYVDINALYHT